MSEDTQLPLDQLSTLDIYRSLTKEKRNYIELYLKSIPQSMKEKVYKDLVINVAQASDDVIKEMSDGLVTQISMDAADDPWI